jgi:hypothetical protein
MITREEECQGHVRTEPAGTGGVLVGTLELLPERQLLSLVQFLKEYGGKKNIEVVVGDYFLMSGETKWAYSSEMN